MSEEIISTKEFRVKGMMCSNCENKVSSAALSVDGVKYAEADHIKGLLKVTYDSEKTNLGEVGDKIKSSGYGFSEECDANQKQSNPIVALALLLVALVLYFFAGDYFSSSMPVLDQNTSLALIFVLGLLTGFHCVAMCGGFVVSYSIKDAECTGGANLKSHLLYGASKTVSYTLIGALFGLLGSFITFTPVLKGIAGILAGIFLVIYGLNMLGLFSSLRIKIKTPSFLDRISPGNRKGPIGIGLLNGLLIACGPLQAMYVLAAASGSPITGATILFVFGLGTLPVLLGFGVITSLISANITGKILKASGVVVILLGLVMLNRGVILTGNSFDLGDQIPASTTTTTQSSTPTTTLPADIYQYIYMNVTRNGWQPDTFTIKKGIPVKWVIDGQEISGCNSAIQVPKYNLEFNIQKGTQTIEFTPNETGTVQWSCWMGMIEGKFIVVD